MKLRINNLHTAVIAIGLLIAMGAANANPPEGKGQKKHQGNGERSSHSESYGGSKVLVSAGISVSSARQIAIDSGINFREYQSLPPGIRKNLARGKPLPPGIAKKVAPPGMIGQLPSYPGYEWQVAGTDLILVQVATAIIADVLSDVFH